MSSLSSEQKQLLFDYCIGLTSERQTGEAEALISSNQEAAEIHSTLKAALSPLESLELESCPDDLAEGTIWRLSNIARSSQLRLEQLLAGEQARKVTAKSRFWQNLGKTVAAAAVIAVFAGVLVPPLNFARYKSRCQLQLANIFRGLNNYIADHDGRLPAVATATGDPWWKVGYQGSENHSNTRHIWLLVKGEYVEPADFVCPACKDRPPQLIPSQIKAFNDFPGRKYMTYSFRIRCRGDAGGKLLCRKVLMADLSPLFERLPKEYSKPLVLRLTKELLTPNSINHKRHGQNVLFGDGRVEFVKTRYIGVSRDDIFTLQDTDIYQGCEVPSCETDIFLAP